jgi:hypothetical protein
MVGPMLERSGSSAYGDLAQRVASATRDSYAGGKASPPSLIAGVISKSLKTERPRTRYAAGKFARPIMALRRWFGDRIYDRVIMSQV